MSQQCALVVRRDSPTLGCIKGRDCPALLGAGVASPLALCVVLGATVYKGRKTIREPPKYGRKDGEQFGVEDV